MQNTFPLFKYLNNRNINKSVEKIIGIDVGGTNIASREYDSTEEKLHPASDIQKISTDLQYLTEAVVHCTKESRDGTSIAGISWSGDIDQESGLVYKGVDKADAKGYDVITPIKKGTEIQKVDILNDADAQVLAAVAVHTKEIRNAVALTIGTGFGIGILNEGNILWSSQFGHTSLGLLENPRATVEDVISGPGLTKMLNQKNFEGTLPKMLNKHSQNESFQNVINQWKTYFAQVIADIQLAYGRNLTFVSGGTGRALITQYPTFLEEINTKAQEILKTRKHLRLAKNLNTVEISCEDAGPRGAAIYALKNGK